MNKTTRKILFAGLLLLLAVACCLYVGDWASSPATHASTMEGLQGKMDTVLWLSGSAAVASAAISALPGDMATPIAGELADFTSYFLIVLCVLMAEKYLAGILGAAAFRILIPLALVLTGVSLFAAPRRLRLLAVRMAAVGLAVFLLIPVSLRLSDAVYRAYDNAIRETVENAEQLSEDAAAFSGKEEDESLWTTLTGTLHTWKDRAADTLNRFLQSLAVTIVTSCLIPVLVLLFFLWIIRQLTGVDLSPRRHRPAKPPEEAEQ